MASVLDIFQTHTGKKLFEKTLENSALNEKELQKAFTFSFPAVLTILENEITFSNKTPNELIEFIDTEDLENACEKALSSFSEKDQVLKLSQVAPSLDLPEKELVKILKISFGVLLVMLHQMVSENPDISYRELWLGLAGYSVKHQEIFLNTLMKGEDKPNLVDNAEKIAFGKDQDNDEPSILGGYSGGR